MGVDADANAGEDEDADAYMGKIMEGSKCGGDGEVGGVIPNPLYPSKTLDDCEYDNGDDD